MKCILKVASVLLILVLLAALYLIRWQPIYGVLIDDNNRIVSSYKDIWTGQSWLHYADLEPSKSANNNKYSDQPCGENSKHAWAVRYAATGIWLVFTVIDFAFLIKIIRTLTRQGNQL